MRSIAPILLTTAISVGCAMPAQEEETEAVGTQEQELLTIDPSLLKPTPIWPYTPVLLLPPSWASKACTNTGKPPMQFLVRRADPSCASVAGKDGVWSRVQTVVNTGPVAICEYQWSGTATPDWAALEASAIKVQKTMDGAKVPDVTGVCSHVPTDCALAPYGFPSNDCRVGPPPSRRLIESMAGCTSCGVTGYGGFYTVLDDGQSWTDWVWGPYWFDPAGQQVVFVPASTGTTNGTILSFH